MSVEQEKNTLPETPSLQGEQRQPDSVSKDKTSKKNKKSGLEVSSHESVKSDPSKDDVPLIKEDRPYKKSVCFSQETPSHIKSLRSGSHVSSSVSAKSDCSRDKGPDFSEKQPSSTKSNKPQNTSIDIGSQFTRWNSLKKQKSMETDVELAFFLLNRVKFEKDSDFSNNSRKNFKENLFEIFQALENKIIIFLKNELDRFKKILKKENTKYFVEDFVGDMCCIKEAALDLTLYFLKYMKQDGAANTLQDALVFINQQRLLSRLTKKYESVSEGIAKHGNSTLLNNIYTDLYITQGCNEQVNTQHEMAKRPKEIGGCLEFQEIQVKCTDLFKAPEQDKAIRTVLTKGVAGIGKSVSVQKVILDWAKRLEKEKTDKVKYEEDKKENKNKKEEKIQKDNKKGQKKKNNLEEKKDMHNKEEDKIQKDNKKRGKKQNKEEDKKENQDINFIFPLPFRELNLLEKKKQSLMDLIAQFFPEMKGLNLTRSNQFNVLFILDGLDECRLPLNFDGNEMWSDVSLPAPLDVLLTNLIKGNLLPSALIWITTRPAAASKIPPNLIERLTEIRGFNDAQKEEYFKKRFTDENQAEEIIYHVKKSKSMFIMCHIPVFCWISATVIHNILEEKKRERNNQPDDASKTQQKSNTDDTPMTLTQMYTHFLRFQIQQSRDKKSEENNGKYTPDVFWNKDAIRSLGKLAFQQLVKNNLIFCAEDLKESGLEVSEALEYSGMCTQIFKEEKGIIVGSMYCFVHLSVQEFIAALYAHLFLDEKKKSVFDEEQEKKKKSETMTDLLKTAVDKALESNNGQLDLFLRFLLGLSLQSNRLLLRGLLTQQDDNDQTKDRLVKYIKQKFDANQCAERSINLFYCLHELNDQTLVEEIQTHLNKGSLSSVDLSPAQWSALVFVLLTSKEELEVFDLQKYKKSDECLIRLLEVVKTSKKALLMDCNLTDKSCPALATVLGSDTNLIELDMNNNNLKDKGVNLLCNGLKNIKCKLEVLRLSKCSLTEASCSDLASVLSSDSSCLKELDLSNNSLKDSGVKLLTDGLNINCKLEKLRLSDCSITEAGYTSLASALKSNLSHLTELDLTGNDPGPSGVKELLTVQQDLNRERFKLELKFLGPDAKEALQNVINILGKNLLIERELNLREHKLDPKQLVPLLKDKHCKLNKLILDTSCITDEDCCALVAALNSNPSSLKELDLSGTKLRDSEIKNLSTLFANEKCKLEKLKLHFISFTKENCTALASVFNSNHSNLNELDLTENQLGDSGVMEISTLLGNSHCTLQILRLSNCSITEGGYKALASALKSNPSHLVELDLTGNDPGPSGVKELSDVLQDLNCKVKLRFLSPAAEEACQCVTGIVGINLLLRKELDLSTHKLGDENVKQLALVLQDKHCKLIKLILNNSGITAEGCAALTSAFNLNPSNLTELDLSGNQFGDSGMEKICPLLKNPQCRLEKLILSDCRITEGGYKALASALKSNRSHLKELDLTGNDPGPSGVKELLTVQQNRHYKSKNIRFLKSSAANEACDFLTQVLGKSPLLLKELDLSGDKLGDLDGQKLSALLMDSHSKVQKIKLNNCKLSEKSCSVLAIVLSSKTILKEISLNESHLLDSGVKEICKALKNPVCELNILKLSKCSLTEESCSDLASVLSSDSSCLKDLDLSNNSLRDSGVKLLSDGLNNKCKLEKLRLSACSITEGGYKTLASALKSNPSHLKELDLTGNDPGPSGVKELLDVTQDLDGQLKLRFLAPDAEKGLLYVNEVLGENLLLKRELNLSERKLDLKKVSLLAALLKDKHCKLSKIQIKNKSITEDGSSDLTSAFKLNPSNLIELDLSGNKLGTTGMKNICLMLKDSECRLEKLKLSDCSINEESYKILTSALKPNPLHLKELDVTGNYPGRSGLMGLFSLFKGGTDKLKTISFLRGPAAEKAYEYLTDALGENPLLLEELDLSSIKLEDQDWDNISALLVDNCCIVQKIKLNGYEMTSKSSSALATVLSSKTTLTEINLNNSRLKDSGVKEICKGLMKSKLKTLELSNCSIAEEGYKALASALKSNPSHLKELDLTGNDPGPSGVEKLSNLLESKKYSLKKLRFLQGPAEEAYQFLTKVHQKNPLRLTELNLNGRKLNEETVNQLTALLKDKHCKFTKLQLRDCGLTEQSCSALSTVLSSNSSLKELDMSNNSLQDLGVKNLKNGLQNKDCTLEKLILSNCRITEGGYKALASALKSNPSHLIELDLTGNDPGPSGVKKLNDLQRDQSYKLKTLRFLSPNVKNVPGLSVEEALFATELIQRDLKLKDKDMENLAALLRDKHCKLSTIRLFKCRITEKQCLTLTSALKSNPSHLRELDLSENPIKNKGVKHLCDVLKDSDCKLERLRLRDCEITDEGCSAMTSALKFNPSHLRELYLSENKLRDSGVKDLSDLLMNTQFKLKTLELSCCEMTENGCSAVTSALKSNPSHLRELDLSGNELRQLGVNNLSDLLKNPQFKLEILNMWGCSITEDQCVKLSSALKSNPSHLRKLDLSANEIQNTGVDHLCEVLKDSDCKLESLSLNKCGITDVTSLVKSLAGMKPLHFLKELDLSKNDIGDSKEQLRIALQDTNCKLSLEKENWFSSKWNTFTGLFTGQPESQKSTSDGAAPGEESCQRTDEFNWQDSGTSV